VVNSIRGKGERSKEGGKGKMRGHKAREQSGGGGGGGGGGAAPHQFLGAFGTKL
jgi:hypothetical protein